MEKKPRVIVVPPLNDFLLFVPWNGILLRQTVHYIYNFPPLKEQIGHFEGNTEDRDAEGKFFAHCLQVFADQ